MDFSKTEYLLHHIEKEQSKRKIKRRFRSMRELDLEKQVNTLRSSLYYYKELHRYGGEKGLIRSVLIAKYKSLVGLARLIQRNVNIEQICHTSKQPA